MEEERAQTNGLADHEDQLPVYRGLKVMPFIIGNETFEKLGTIGALSNLTVYFTEVFNMKNVSAATLINVFNGTSNMSPLVGAYLSDTYFGRYKTLGFASVSSFLGLISITLTATFPALHPPQCSAQSTACVGPTSGQLAFLFVGLGLLVIGAGGTARATSPLVKVRPDGSPLTSLTQVLVAAVRKRRLTVPDQPTVSLFNHVSKKSTNSKLPSTDQFRFLDKSAVIMPVDGINIDGSASNSWRLCSALQLDRLSRSTDFKIPAASHTVFTSLSLTLWVPVYDRILVPALRRITGK
ncbi:hypothetical protein CRG98_045164, partial [Punica granatum]